MKILYFSQFYHPERIAPAFRATDQAEIWAQHDAQVTIFTAYPNYPTGIIFGGYTPTLLSEESRKGDRILRSKIIAKKNANLLGRILSGGSFAFFGMWNILANRKKIGSGYDVCLTTSGTIFAGVVGYLYAWRTRTPFVFELRDITYKQMIATGSAESSLKVRLVRRLELFFCRKARMVVVVTNGFKQTLIQEGNIPPKKIKVITNGIGTATLRQSKVTPTHLTLSYFGTLGISQGVHNTLPYAQAIQALISDFTYLIVGDGAQSGLLDEASKSHSFVERHGGMSAEDLDPYYEQTDLSIVVLQKSDAFRGTLPSKLFQIMGRGIAVLFIGPDGEAAQILRKHHAGIALTQTPEADIKQLQAFFSQSNWAEQLQVMGENGKRAVQEKYLRATLAVDYLRELEACIHGQPA